MRVPKAYIGRMVALTWRDPIGVQRAPVAEALKGNAGLATWREHGVIDDITEEVVRIVHSIGYPPGTDGHKPDEISYTLVPEDRIIGVVLFKEEVIP